MTLQTLTGPIYWPGLTSTGFRGAPSFTTRSILDAAGEYIANIIYAERDMTISHVGLKPGGVSGSPTADIRIETVDATTGLPSGTLWATNTNIVTGALAVDWAVHALTASASITKGQVFCIKVAYNSGTSLTTALISNVSQVSTPYIITNTGSPTKNVVGEHTTMALMSDANTPYQVMSLWPVHALTNNAFNNTSSARRGMRFQVPFKCRCIGIRFMPNSTAGDFNAILFNDAGTELSSSSTAVDGSNIAGTFYTPLQPIFDNAVTLDAATWYRAVIEPSSATNCNITTVTVPAAGLRAGLPGGTSVHYTTYVASSWTDTATDQVPLMDLIIDQLDDGAGGGASKGKLTGLLG